MPEVSKHAYSYRDDPAVPAFDDTKALFVFDGICVLCSGGTSWIMRHDSKARVNFTPAQEDLGQALYVHYGIEKAVFNATVVPRPRPGTVTGLIARSRDGST